MAKSTATASAAVDAEISFDGDKYCFAKFIDRSTVERVQNHKNAICGHAHPLLHRTVPGREIIEFAVVLDITSDIIGTLLPYMTVASSGVNTWDSDETLGKFDIIVNKVGAVHKYTNVRIRQWRFNGQRGSMPVSLMLECVADSETNAGATTFTPGGIGPIFGFVGTSFEIDADGLGYVSYPIDRVAVVSDLTLARQWNSSKTMTDALLTHQETFIAASLPYVSSSQDVYWTNKDDVTPRKIRLSFFTQGTDDVLRFTLPAAVMIPKSPDIMGKSTEIRMPLTWQAHIDASTDPDTPAFQIELVNTP